MCIALKGYSADIASHLPHKFKPSSLTIEVDYRTTLHFQGNLVLMSKTHILFREMCELPERSEALSPDRGTVITLAELSLLGITQIPAL